MHLWDLHGKTCRKLSWLPWCAIQLNLCKYVTLTITSHSYTTLRAKYHEWENDYFAQLFKTFSRVHSHAPMASDSTYHCFLTTEKSIRSTIRLDLLVIDDAIRAMTISFFKIGHSVNSIQVYSLIAVSITRLLVFPDKNQRRITYH